MKISGGGSGAVWKACTWDTLGMLIRDRMCRAGVEKKRSKIETQFLHPKWPERITKHFRKVSRVECFTDGG